MKNSTSKKISFAPLTKEDWYEFSGCEEANENEPALISERITHGDTERFFVIDMNGLYIMEIKGNGMIADAFSDLTIETTYSAAVELAKSITVSKLFKFKLEQV